MKTLLFSVVIILSNLNDIYSFDKCLRTWRKVGCFHDRIIPDRPLPNELLNIRDPYNSHWDRKTLIDWYKWPETLLHLACKCYELTKARGHRFFGLQFYGECWTGPKSFQYMRDGKSDKCVGVDYLSCNDTAKTECVGKAFTNYIYDTEGTIDNPENPVDGNWNEWSEWTPCSKSCAGGVRDRYRECNNPEAKHGGKECEGEPEEVQACNTEKCAEECKKQMEIALAVDASSSITKANFNIIKEFLRKLTTHFSVSENGIHFGQVTFGFRVSTNYLLSDKRYWNPKSLESKILKTYYLRGNTKTGGALKVVNEKFFCKTCLYRPAIPKVLIIITDGKSSDRDRALLPNMVKELKEKRVTIISVGIGQDIDRSELLMMAKDGDHVILIKDFKNLVEIMNRILRLSCQASRRDKDYDIGFDKLTKLLKNCL